MRRRLTFLWLLILACAPLWATPVWRTSPRVSALLVGGSMMNGANFSDSTLPTMREHFAGCKRVALILHASHPSERDGMEKRMQVAFAHIDVPEAISLHRMNEAEAAAYLAKADAIWVGGGETFVLLAELYRTGQLAIIRERVLAGVPYGGSSAGANVAGLLIGTTNDFPTAEVPTREALAIFPAVINPHHPTPETKADYDGRVGKILTYRKFNPGESVIGLANAAMVRLHAGKITVPNGAVWLYAGNGQRELKPGADVTELVLAKSAAK